MSSLAACATALAILFFATSGYAQLSEATGPPPGTTGNADNIRYIGEADPDGNPVRLARRTGHVSNYDESKVLEYTLPDPLIVADGSPVQTADRWWNRRRPEILQFYETQIYGRVPDDTPEVRWHVEQVDNDARSGAAVMKRVAGRMGDDATAKTLPLTVYYPKDSADAVPVLLSVSFFSTARSGPPRRPRGGAGGNRFDPVAEVLDRGWAYATIGYGDIQPDRPNQWNEGVIGLTLEDGQTQPASDQWGTISAWAWGISRVIDFFESDPSIDKDRIAIHGASRLGKTVLWAAAQDQRVAAVFSAVPGEMGASLIRRDWGETLDDMAQNFPWQFAGNLQNWVGRWNELPVDQHLLIASIAPRPVYVNGGLGDQWSDPQGQFLALVAAGPVYRLLGAQDLGTDQLPQLDHPLVAGNLGFHYHSQGHRALPEDWKQFLDMAERCFVSKDEAP